MSRALYQTYNSITGKRVMEHREEVVLLYGIAGELIYFMQTRKTFNIADRQH